MAYKLFNRVLMTVSGTPGTGAVTLGSALSGYQTLANAGISNGDTFPYLIVDGTTWEYGVGTYTSSGTSFTRSVTWTSNQNTSAISASSAAQVSCTLRAEDVGGTPALSTLTDVSLSSPANLDLLTYNTSATKWKNRPPNGFVLPDFNSALTASTHLNSATITSRTSAVDMPSVHVKPGSSDSASTIYASLQNAPSGNFSMVMKFKTLTVGAPENSLQGMGMMVRNNTNGYISAAIFCPIGGASGAPYEFTHTLGTGGSSSWATGSADGKALLFGTDLFMHIDWISGTGLKLGVSVNATDPVWYYTETNITSPQYCGPIWVGSYGTIGGTGNIGPEYDIYHYFAGTQGTNGITG